MSQVANCFQKAHPNFNYYGPSEFRNDNLDDLLANLMEWISRCRLCNTEADFRNLLKPYFLVEAQAAAQSWDEQWAIVRDELMARISEIRDTARLAKRERKTLLVLGV